MLKIINDLKPFFEDCYKEINVREYARLQNISPPTASSLLKLYFSENLLKMESDKGYLLFRANRDSLILKDLSRVYWFLKLGNLINFLNEMNIKTIILFGSLSKLESNKDSDIDLFIAPKQDIDIKRYESALKRKIQIFSYDSINDIKNKELKNNILNGYLIKGRFE
jgi:predicted nucleotidyltransferase